MFVENDVKGGTLSILCSHKTPLKGTFYNPNFFLSFQIAKSLKKHFLRL